MSCIYVITHQHLHQHLLHCNKQYPYFNSVRCNIRLAQFSICFNTVWRLSWVSWVQGLAKWIITSCTPIIPDGCIFSLSFFFFLLSFLLFRSSVLSHLPLALPYKWPWAASSDSSAMSRCSHDPSVKQGEVEQKRWNISPLKEKKKTRSQRVRASPLKNRLRARRSEWEFKLGERDSSKPPPEGSTAQACPLAYLWCRPLLCLGCPPCMGNLIWIYFPAERCWGGWGGTGLWCPVPSTALFSSP